MKLLRSLLAYIVPLWAIFVTIFYFSTHKKLFWTAWNVYSTTLGHDLLNVFLFSMANLFLLSILLGGWIFLSRWLRKSWMIKWGGIHFISFFLISILLVFSLRFSWDDFTVYRGTPIVATETSVEPYLGGPFPEHTLFYLLPSDLVPNPQKALSIYYKSLSPFLTSVSFPKALFTAGSRLFIPLFLILVFLLASYSIGYYLLWKIHRKPITPETILYSIGLGTIFYSFGLFILAQLSLLTLFPVTVFLLLPLLFGATPLGDLLTLLKTHTISFDKIPWLSRLILIGIFLILSWNFIEMASILPAGFDDFHLYLNLPNLLAEHGTFLRGEYYPYSFSLIQALGPLLLGSIQFSKLIVYAFGILVLPIIYNLSRKYSSSQLSLFLILIFLSLPTIFSHFHIQVKTELPLLFFGTLSLLCLHHWLEDRKTSSWLWLTGLFIGFAFTIKISAILLIATLFFIIFSSLFGRLGSLIIVISGITAYGLNSDWFQLNSFYGWGLMLILGLIIVIILKRTHSFKKSFSHFLIIFFFSLMVATPSIPWWINNIATSTGDFSLNLLTKDASIPKTDYDFSPVDYGDATCVGLNTTKSDFARYSVAHDNPFLAAFLLPWDFTIHSSARTIFSDIGYLFLAFIPILFVGLPPHFLKKKKSRDLAYLFLAGGIYYWIFWALIAQGVIWYGITGFWFLLFALLLGIQLLIQYSIFSRYLTIFLLIFWIFSSFFLRSNMFLGRTYSLIPYFSGLITSDEYIDQNFQSYPEAVDLIGENSVLFLTSQVNFRYFIPSNDTRIYFDNYLEKINCLFVERKGDLLVSRLKAAGFKYLGLSRVGGKDPNFSDEFFELEKELFDFASTSLPVFFTNGGTYLFQL